MGGWRSLIDRWVGCLGISQLTTNHFSPASRKMAARSTSTKRLRDDDSGAEEEAPIKQAKCVSSSPAAALAGVMVPTLPPPPPGPAPPHQLDTGKEHQKEEEEEKLWMDAESARPKAVCAILQIVPDQLLVYLNDKDLARYRGVASACLYEVRAYERMMREASLSRATPTIALSAKTATIDDLITALHGIAPLCESQELYLVLNDIPLYGDPPKSKLSQFSIGAADNNGSCWFVKDDSALSVLLCFRLRLT